MSRLIKDLSPIIQGIASDAWDKMRKDPKLKSLGVDDVIISETKRELAVQMAYYSRSRMKNSADVKKMYLVAGLYNPTEAECNTPNTWTLDSKHIKGLAVDFVPVKNKAAWWSAPASVWERMGEIGEACGLSWGGRWKNKDCPHFEL